MNRKRQENLLFYGRALRRNVILFTLLFCLWLVWALWLKFNSNDGIVQGYRFLSKLTLQERFMFGLEPTNPHKASGRQLFEIVANCIVFAPFGVLFNLLAKKKNIFRDLVICLGISLFFELLQLFTAIGAFATIDLISNPIGYIFGYIAYELIFRRLPVRFNLWLFRIANIGLIVWLSYAAVQTAKSMDIIIGILTRTL